MCKLIVPDLGDTLIENIEYGKKIRVIVHGNKGKREYDVKHCLNCKSFIPAKYMPSKDRGYKLIPTGQHNQRKFCEEGDCLSEFRVKTMSNTQESQGKKVHGNNKIKGYPSIRVSKERQQKFSDFVVGL